MGVDLFFQTMERLTPQLRAGDLARCESAACDALRALPRTPFHIAADLAISNDPAEAAAHFDDFYRAESGRMAVRAVYTEMNGFDINPDRWYCDLFAYNADGGLNDFDWLSDWQSEPAVDYTITGLEPLQKVYASKAFHNPKNKDASYLSSLVVVTKFQRFMQRTAERMSVCRVPLYATAHDFDYIARLVPGGKQSAEPPAAQDPAGPSKPTAMGRLTPSEWLERLTGHDRQQQKKAVGRVCQLATENAEYVEVLHNSLAHPNDKIVFWIVTHMWSLGTAARVAVPELIRLLERHPPFGVRQMVLTALAEIAPDTAEAKRAIFGAFADPHPSVRCDALHAAIKVADLLPEDLAQIEGMGNDPDKDVVFWSEIALRNIRLRSEAAQPLSRPPHLNNNEDSATA